jgi:predicted nuclease with TOPRIM domain|tara:strand:+ start:73 stop:300 length:228 start_codon:yes stop_codon:yes gene_type:complete
MKKTENNQQLLQRFSKRIKQLSEEQGKLDESYERWLELDKQLTRLEGSVQAIEYLEYGKLPGDGNHDGMKDHDPS